MKPELKTYTVGTRCFCDFPFGGKPHGKVIAVIQPGSGQRTDGLVTVELTETVGAYKKGEKLNLNPWQAVPNKQVIGLRRGEFFTRISTLYRYENP